jgi:cutinase
MRTVPRRPLTILALAVCAAVAAAPAAPGPARASARAAASCAATELVVARGTSEPGTLGVIVGDPLAKALRAQRPGLKTYAVNYPASGGKGSAEIGDRDLVAHLRSQAAACPRRQFVLAGYSQGANVVEMALGEDTSKVAVGGPSVARIPKRLTSRIRAIVLFGNPMGKIGRTVPLAYRSRTLDTCNTGDVICDPKGTEAVKHVQYGPFVDRAATFAAHRVQRRAARR